MTYPYVSPSSITILAAETVPLAIDFDAVVGVGESISSASAVLTDLTTGQAYSAGLSGTASVASTTVTQSVTALLAGKKYRMVISVVVGTRTEAQALDVNCPF